jgi:BarA-like signal transduction histidine kinase
VELQQLQEIEAAMTYAAAVLQVLRSSETMVQYHQSLTASAGERLENALKEIALLKIGSVVARLTRTVAQE